MGCKLIRGETIYFVRHGGGTAATLESEWLADDKDRRLLPPVFTRSGRRRGNSPLTVIPIDVQCFDPS